MSFFPDPWPSLHTFGNRALCTHDTPGTLLGLGRHHCPGLGAHGLILLVSIAYVSRRGMTVSETQREKLGREELSLAKGVALEPGPPTPLLVAEMAIPRGLRPVRAVVSSVFGSSFP